MPAGMEDVKAFEQCCTELLAQREMQKSVARVSEKNNAQFCTLVWLRRQQTDHCQHYAALLEDAILHYHRQLLAYDTVTLNFVDIQ